MNRLERGHAFQLACRHVGFSFLLLLSLSFRAQYLANKVVEAPNQTNPHPNVYVAQVNAGSLAQGEELPNDYLT